MNATDLLYHPVVKIVQLAQNASYSEEGKATFKRASLSFLKQLAALLDLSPSSFEIRFNPGGIAVSGEATLHHERFYLQISSSGAYWRTCKGLKDYCGDTNNWIVFYQTNPNTDWGIHLSNIRRVISPQNCT